MIIIDLMILILFIITITLLSGKKIISNHRWLQIILTISAMYSPLSTFIEGYKQGYIVGYTEIVGIVVFAFVMLIIFIWGYRNNTYRYTIHNVEKEDVINIVEAYLKRKNISYNLRNDEIDLIDTHNSIYIRSSVEIILDFEEIKNTYFYKEIVSEVKSEIKKIEKKHRSIEGILYLVFTLFFVWIRFTFLKGFI